MTKKQKKTKGKLPNIPPPEASSASDTFYPQISFDELIPFLDGSGWTEEEKIKYLQTIWALMCDITAIYFGTHPVHLACGQVSESDADGTFEGASVLNSSHRNLIKEFIENSGADKAPREEGVAG